DYSLLGYFKQTFFKKIISRKSKEIISDIINAKPNILHVHIHPKELNLGIIIEQKIKCKLIYTQHSVHLTPPTLSLNILGIIFRFTYRKYHLIAVSQSALDEIKQHRLLGIDKTLTLIENKLNLNLFKLKQKQTKDYISVVYVARIGFPKGHAELIHAWSKLINEPTKKKLFLVGPDGMNNEIQELVEKIVPNNSVVFLGAQYNIAAILNECDFAVFPSFKEGLPLALLEKMAMELPVIVSDIPELTNIVEDSVNGLVFKSGDVDDLAKKITFLLQNPEVRLQLGKNAKKTILDRFGSLNIALPNEKVYEKIMKYL
ncbi:MAG TPA: glycosyltransferase family 4 protein, partial [Bacteroidia bacterium]|nr:glycosyltransferase family 4 protein [Bacteroidia bacterium]